MKKIGNATTKVHIRNEKSLPILTIIEDPGVATIDRPGVILKPIKLADVSNLEPTAKFETNE